MSSATTSYQVRTEAAQEHYESLQAKARELLFPPVDRPKVKPIPEGWGKRIRAFLKYSPSLAFGDDILWVVISLWFWFWALFVAITILNAVGIIMISPPDSLARAMRPVWTVEVENSAQTQWQIVVNHPDQDHWQVNVDPPDDESWRINVFRGDSNQKETETGTAGMVIERLSIWIAVPLVLTMLLLIAATALALVSTPWFFMSFWGEKYRHSREGKEKLLFVILNLLFVISVVIAAVVFITSFPAIFQAYSSNDPIVKLTRVAAWIFLYVNFAISPLMVGYRLLWSLLSWGIEALILRPIYFILSAHQPFSSDQIRALVAEPMSAGEESRTWRLEELEDAEIQLIREWAEVNRKTTEKRLLPTTVIFGAVGLFGDTDAFNNAVHVAVSWMQRLLSTNDPFRNVLSGFVIGWAWAFVLILLKLLANISVQSLIIEVCMVAEYGVSGAEE
jgi:hypothetical protein